jgi:hypothetical protein
MTQQTAETIRGQVREFFQAFEANTSSSDPAAMGAAYADVFMAAGPQGAQIIRTAEFVAALPRRKQLFDELGCGTAQLISLEQTPLGSRYVMASTRWSLPVDRPQGAPEQIEFESSFILDTGANPFRIVLYLPHQDLLAMVKEQTRGQTQS